MYQAELKTTLNIKTNKLFCFQFICGSWQRISQSRFNYLKLMNDRIDCCLTKVSKTHIRHSAIYYYEYAPF